MARICSFTKLLLIDSAFNFNILQTVCYFIKIGNVGVRQKGLIGKVKSLVRANSSDSDSDNDDFEKFNMEGVKEHNKYRQLHGVGPVKFNKEVAKYAQNWAETLANSGKFEHSTSGKYGENLYTFYSSGAKMATAAMACESWYSEIKDYQFGVETGNHGTGHFTQMIWKGTTEIGMGRAKGSKGWIIVANYYPPGNVIGRYLSNVPRPI